MKYALSDDIEEASQVVKFYWIKRVLDNSRHNFDSALLRSMSITLGILEGMEGYGGRYLPRHRGYCCKTGDRTTSSVKHQNIRKPGQEKAGTLAKRNRRLNVNQHKGIVKPNMCSNTNSRTIPASDTVSRKFAKERMLQSQSSHGSVEGCKRPLAGRQARIKGRDEVVADMKFQATKRKMQELYQKAETGYLIDFVV
ncbi:uncharacterized protein LOC115662120 isoform X2 [Syzygium oleosum]|uniref:uncharacterized protein LOC115662120 isoform X2 n=1 Tax=Syzygium oleosum TaxID=219896 RepID=UPI0024B90A19|nr:uncharacterized protein LOC115662120 isoform X2 [Syzygium oleosum]